MVTAPAFSMAPALNSGTKSWSYFSNGYGQPNWASKNSKPCRVSSKMLSASRYCMSDLRAKMPSGVTLPAADVTSLRTDWYGPAISAVT
ncbi:hypothetical protein SRABI128_06487 [Microbacterium sp. Bi128]|nr:hypothetical protein SRABI128_06487 [Microbacterium sp. Bi128]